MLFKPFHFFVSHQYPVSLNSTAVVARNMPR